MNTSSPSEDSQLTSPSDEESPDEYHSTGYYVATVGTYGFSPWYHLLTDAVRFSARIWVAIGEARLSRDVDIAHETRYSI